MLTGLLCRDFATNNRSNSSCPQPRPASQAQCPCEDAFAPIATSLVSAGCPAEWSEAECECCPNGVVDSAGECCSSANTVAMVDMKGKCCAAGYIDACGVCGGDGVYLDRQGTCCKVCHPVATLCTAMCNSSYMSCKVSSTGADGESTLVPKLRCKVEHFLVTVCVHCAGCRQG